MKTILVDAWNSFVTEEGVDVKMKEILDGFDNPKIILTNANEEQKVKLGIVDMPYPVFSLAHEPDKVDPEYYIKFFEKYSLSSEDVIYFEHDEGAVESAKSLGIDVHHFDYSVRDMDRLKEFLELNLDTK